jgi:hypothetical protein
MYIRLQIALWSAAAVLSVGYSTSEAANKKNPPTKATALAPAKSSDDTHHFAHVIAELHNAKHLLDHANHAYNGHRAKADHEIDKAIHLLHHEHHKSGTTAKSTVGRRELQQAPDAALHQAEKLVHAAILELHHHNHDEKAHHAVMHLHEAAHEIALAIHLHHKHHQK